MAKAKNGHNELDMPEQAVLRGRPARKVQDPVRRGIWAMSRSLREIQNMWNQFVQYDDDAGDWVTSDAEGVEHVKRAVEFLGSRISTITKGIDSRLAAEDVFARRKPVKPARKGAKLSEIEKPGKKAKRARTTGRATRRVRRESTVKAKAATEAATA